jgi:transposase
VLRLPTLGDLDRSSAARIFLCTQPTDMRRSFDRLAEMVKESLAQDPLGGNLFVFRSRAADKLKILYWDSDGFCIWYKRLEEGAFRFPRVVEGQSSVEVRASELAMLLEGIDLRSVKRTPRFKRSRSIPQRI